MKGKQIALLIFLGLLFLVSVNKFYSVHETKQAIVLQFGRPVGAPITDAGLKIKVPFIQQVQFLDRRILDLDSPAEEVIASDQKRLVVDSFTRWQISDPLQFYISVRDERIARSRLQAIVSSSLRSVLGGEEFVTVVRDERDELMARISEIVNVQANDLGINIIDVRIKRADLPDANSQAIYRRMQTERQQEAAEFRAKGQEISRGIRAEAEGQAKRFVSIYSEYIEAKDVTRQRLFLETMEKVFNDMNKVIIDSDAVGGQGVLPYLPLNEVRKKGDQ